MDEAHILLVDDEPAFAAALRDFLETKGYRVSAALTAVDALQQIESASFSLLVVDLHLQRHSGMDIVSAARRRNLSCVLLTGSVVDGSALRVEAGVADVIWKCEPLINLLSKIRRAVGS